MTYHTTLERRYGAVRKRLYSVRHIVDNLDPEQVHAKDEEARVIAAEVQRQARLEAIEVALALPESAKVAEPADDEIGGVQVKLADLAWYVCYRHNVPMIDLVSHRRTDGVVRARHHFCYLARTLTTKSLTQIGRFLGRDHTTVMHGIRKHCDRNDLAYPGSGG